ncbi:MarR family winged helix-turn-helix transcriptional regulator [Sneathiella limimaris]|uniref:MarR family winged helix-turn-helix transcriptional regulator n=1 Tax=Sneathiella limimaris TaxID=1964213 RepID=UPI001469F41A|nr:MarR family transcriptional regulator [Sneathiella limimaris]
MIELHEDFLEQGDRNSPEKHRLRLWLRILKISRQIEGELRERFRTQFKSTLPRFDVMSALYRQESGLKMSELSTALMVSNGNVTGIIERLVSEKMVVREPIPGDRRAMRVRLSEKGRSEFAHMAAVHQEWINELLAGVSAEDADLIGRLLDISKTADKNRPDGGSND